MRFGKDGSDPTARRRQDRDAALRVAQEIVARHVRGESVRVIARAVKLPRTSVHRVIVEYRRAQRDAEVDAEAAALLSKYDVGLSCEDVTRPEQIAELSDLEYLRLSYLPPGHPARLAATAAGYRRPALPNRW